MKANVLTPNKAKRKLKEMVKTESAKHCAKCLEQLLGAYAEANESFKEDLADGVAWTKIVKHLEAIGLEFSEEDIEIGKAKERLFEKGITYYGKKGKR